MSDDFTAEGFADIRNAQDGYVDELKQQLAAERAKVALAVEQTEQCRREQNTLHGGESKHDKAMLVGRVDGLQVALNILAALQSADALADIRREVARECANDPKIVFSTDVAKAIRAKFGVKP